MKAVFVTGTDTGVGKTLVTGLLARYLREQDCRVITQKWVQTGIREDPLDTAAHTELMGVEDDAIQQYAKDVTPYTFQLPASPHLAAAHENTQIDPQRIIASFRRLSEAFDTVIVEGAGGLMVPLNDQTLLLDVVSDLALPVVVVAANKLGAVNHTLLTIEALRTRNIDVPGIVFNTLDPNQDEAVLQDNPKIVQAFAGVPILGQLPRSNDSELLYRHFKPIAAQIWAHLSKDLTE